MEENGRKWTFNRLKNLVANAYFDLFSVGKPSGKDIELWLTRYLKRETFYKKQKNKTKKQ